MAWRSFKKDLDKTYQKIDKIAKKGKDNFQEYYDYIDNLIINKQYGVLTQVLFIKYDFDYTKYFSVTDVKEQSWKNILFRTKSFSQPQQELRLLQLLLPLQLQLIPQAERYLSGESEKSNIISDLNVSLEIYEFFELIEHVFSYQI